MSQETSTNAVRYYLSFWNVLNSTLYTLLTVSFITRMIALGHPLHTEPRFRMNVRIQRNIISGLSL